MSVHKVDPPAISGYRYQRHLGTGGFSEVFLYSSESIDKDFAVKVLAEGRPAIEAKAARLEHPNVVKIVYQGETDGHHWIVMEYCPGDPLSERVKSEGPQRIDRVLRWGVQLASALHAVHKGGLVHRDIKPANVFTDKMGEPKLGDFGIAASIAEAAGQAAASVQWAPPEVLQHGTASVAGDVYSLAATLWTLLAGRPPFVVERGDNSIAAVTGRTLQARLGPLGRDCPELERVLRRAMAQEPAERFGSALDFGHALQGVEQGLGFKGTDLLVDEESSQKQGLHEGAGDKTSVKATVIEAEPEAEAAGHQREERQPPPRVRPPSPEEDPIADPPDTIPVVPEPEASESPMAGRRKRSALLAGIATLVVVGAVAVIGLLASGGKTSGRNDQQPGPGLTLPTGSSSKPRGFENLKAERLGNDNVQISWTGEPRSGVAVYSDQYCQDPLDVSGTTSPIMVTKRDLRVICLQAAGFGNKRVKVGDAKS